MPNVPLRAGTKILVSGHPATLTFDATVNFTDLPNEQAIVESLMNDPHNYGLNKDLYVAPVVEEGASEPWIKYDEETDSVSAPGYVTDMQFVGTTSGPVVDTAEVIELAVDPVDPLKLEKPKRKSTKKAASKPVKEKAKQKVKKGKK